MDRDERARAIEDLGIDDVLDEWARTGDAAKAADRLIEKLPAPIVGALLANLTGAERP